MAHPFHPLPALPHSAVAVETRACFQDGIHYLLPPPVLFSVSSTTDDASLDGLFLRHYMYTCRLLMGGPCRRLRGLVNAAVLDREGEHLEFA